MLVDYALRDAPTQRMAFFNPVKKRIIIGDILVLQILQDTAVGLTLLFPFALPCSDQAQTFA